ncbi:MAG: YhcH/YjgK/YiaL family protein [Bacteroidales bacterium]|nr:YhcH/YjgK/YiaL family protein [Bacteroidales bacterium]
MILDSLKSFEKYQTLQEGFDKVYQFIKKNDLYSMECGKYEIDGKRVYCTISEGELRDVEEAKLEIHDSYIDIHVLLDGSETIGLTDRSKCNTHDTKYQEADDIAFLNDEPENYVVLGVGNIAIIFPADSHAPLLGSGNYKKAVFKVHVGNNRSRLIQ